MPAAKHHLLAGLHQQPDEIRNVRRFGNTGRLTKDIVEPFRSLHLLATDRLPLAKNDSRQLRRAVFDTVESRTVRPDTMRNSNHWRQFAADLFARMTDQKKVLPRV